jgi:hypothetical protein
LTGRRDRRGRFLKGNPGGPGRPPRPTEETYLCEMLDACPPAAWRQICARAVQDAQSGNAKAREWLGRHLVGDPSFASPKPVVALAALISGNDPVLDQIADPIVQRELGTAMFPSLAADDETADRIKAAIAKELASLEEPSTLGPYRS